MNPSEESGQDAKPSQKESADIAAILDMMWARFLPDIRDRVAVLETAAAVFTAHQVSPQQRESAHSAAHKLAGTLGIFGLMHGTEMAREFEQLTATDEALAAATQGQLNSLATEIRIIIESRK